jgi:hypothetical protein
MLGCLYAMGSYKIALGSVFRYGITLRKLSHPVECS